MKVLYTTQATSTGGRTGHSKTTDGVLDLDLITPKELGGPGNPPGGKGTNPEQLFACGYSACFLGAMKFVAGQEKLDRKSTRLNSSHLVISYAVFCLKKKTEPQLWFNGTHSKTASTRSIATRHAST